MRVLPKDVYDTIEFSALAHKGIGAPTVGDYEDGVMVCPTCIYGHAFFASGAEDFMSKRDPIYTALRAANISGTSAGDSTSSDAAVYRINARKGRLTSARVTFREWCAELNVVRGDS